MVSVLVMGAGIGAIIDVRRRRIPNVIVVATAAAGLVLAFTGISEVSPWSSLLGLAGGLLLMLPRYALAATGAGDVKMFAAAGAVIGAGRLLDAFLATLIAGGVFALAVVVWRAGLKGNDGSTTFAYGPAIAAGAVIAVLIR